MAIPGEDSDVVLMPLRGSNTVSRGIPGAGIFIGKEINATNGTVIECPENAETAAAIIFVVAGLGMGANVMIMFLILARRNLRR